MGRLGNSSRTLIRHDYKKACYRAMLSEFPVEDVKAFFSRVPLILDGRVIKGRELYSLLWADSAEIPIYFDNALDNALEPFLLEMGMDVAAFMDKVLWLNNQSTYIPGKVLLTWFYPKMEAFFDSLDSRDMIFPLITLFTENYLPGHIHRRIKRWQEGEWTKSVQVFISDPSFEEFVDWDYEFIAGPQIMQGPVMFGMPPFERFRMLADTRYPEQVVWSESDRPAYSGDSGEELALGGQVAGRRMSFHAFCREREIDLSKFNPPDLEGVVMTRDYACPRRKRVVLHEGCFYGAPLFLNSVEHRKIALQGKGLLANLVADIAREEAANKDALAARHRELIASLAGSSHFAYYSGDESLMLNGAYFTKGVPAKIMKSLLNSYVSERKQEFEYRDLKRDFEISQGQKNANFEVRFYRLVDKLQAESQGVRLEKTGRGRFRLSVDGDFSFREE